MAETDFEGFTLEQLQAMVATANPSALAGYGQKLTGAAGKITTAAENLARIARGMSDGWQGESADAFQLLAGQLVAATNGLGDYANAAGGHINHVGEQIFVAKLGMPRVDPTTLAKANGPAPVVPPGTPPPADGVDPVKAHADAQGQVEAARREAITRMRTLASTYRVAATDLQAIPVPVFPGGDERDGRHGAVSIVGPGSGSPGSGGSGSGGTPGPPAFRAGGGGSSPGIYTAPPGHLPSGGTTSPAPINAPTPYAPQVTNLQGTGSLTAPDSSIDNPWAPQPPAGGSGPGSTTGGSPPSGNLPGVPPLSGSGPATSPAGSGRYPGGPGLPVIGGGGRGGTSGGSSGSVTPRSGGPYGGPVVPPGSTPRSGGPQVGGGRGAFNTQPEARGPGASSPSGAGGTGSPGRTPGMPGAPGVGGSAGSPISRASGSRLAHSQGGSVGNASGAASRRNSPRLQALPADGSAPEPAGAGTQQRMASSGQRTPFTGGSRSEQVLRRAPRPEEDDDNVWDGPRRPGVVPPVID